jgi:hypothetical protein
MAVKYTESGVPQCDDCELPAVYNLQSGSMLWSIDDKGEYEKLDFTPDEDDNYHFCEEHYQHYRNN